MHRQVGDLVLDSMGIARRGLLIRHLVMPDDLAGSSVILDFIVNQLSPNTYLNIMDQYRPAYKARKYPGLDRRLSFIEFQGVLQEAEEKGLTRLDR